RRALIGRRASPAFIPTKVARSRAVHSHSRFRRIDSGPEVPDASLSSGVSIRKTFTPLLRSTSPLHQLAECSWLPWPPMNELLGCIGRTLWWWRRDRYEASPVAVDFQPPSIDTRLMFT